MADKTKHSDSSQSVATKPITEVKRYKDSTGTYAVTLVEQKRVRITTEDDLIEVIAWAAEQSEKAYDFEKTLSIIGRKDPYKIFAQEFVQRLKKDTKVNDLVKSYLADSEDIANPQGTL